MSLLTPTRTSQQGLEFIIRHEGLQTHAYQDVAGVWTIGVGHTAEAGEPRPTFGMAIKRDDALAILQRDLASCEAVARAAGCFTTQHAFDAAVDFDFNTGALHDASWVGAYRDGYGAAARQRLALWRRAHGQVIAALVRRRAEEADLLLDGIYAPARNIDTTNQS